MRTYRNLGSTATLPLSTTVISSLIELSQEVNTNPNSLYIDLSAPAWYNTELYCTNVLKAASDFQIDCTNYGDSIYDGNLRQPAGLWGSNTGVSTVNETFFVAQYRKQSTAIRQIYQQLACNVSSLIHREFRTQTSFHDEYVVRYLNRRKDPNFVHDFTVGNWTELGLAQWGGGFVTHALERVRSTKLIVREGMWNFGEVKFYENYLEFGTWAARQGYPGHWIYNISDARLLLDYLSSNSSEGLEFRRHLMYTGSTFIGDGETFINGVGAVGEVTFTPEANRGNFSCPGTAAAGACELLNTFVDSTAAQCVTVNNLYLSCYNSYLFATNRWISFDDCSAFETSLSNPSTGIPCDLVQVYGNLHPYSKSRGNVVYHMLYSLTYLNNLLDGLWCADRSNCAFDQGGMFATATAQQVLFEGFTDASILYYFDKYYAPIGVSFSCQAAPYDTCGNKNYICDFTAGLVLTLPNSDRYLLAYNATPHDEYFAPYFVVKTSGEMLWPYSSNTTLAALHQARMITESSSTISTVRNPFWTAFPAYDNNATDFLKYFQCQKRIFFGPPDLFSGCDHVIYTGADVLTKAAQLLKFYGNDTLQYFDAEDATIRETDGVAVNGTVVGGPGAGGNQLAAQGWDGFDSYPYDYLGRTAGPNFRTITEPVLFNKETAIPVKLSQSSLIFQTQREFSLTFPLPTDSSRLSPTSPTASVPIRRFVEISTTWSPYQTLASPRDSYGMTYKIPIGVASMQKVADFPLFIETAGSYGNELWGGISYSDVQGVTRNQYSQRSFVDYDPVTGRALRMAIRQQVTLRVEASAIFPVVFSSQQRCIAPSKTYSQFSGYGCFGYLPLLWIEDARTMDTETFFQLYDHFYTRPDRGNTITLAGVTTAVIFIVLGTFLFVNEAYHRRRFQRRVYVD